MKAAEKGHGTIVQALINAGADASIRAVRRVSTIVRIVACVTSDVCFDVTVWAQCRGSG
jgi:hypothetical protein